VKRHFGVVAWLYLTFMLVAPDDQVQKFWEEVLRQIACLGVGEAKQLKLVPEK
jgi:hypothetical protein